MRKQPIIVVLTVLFLFVFSLPAAQANTPYRDVDETRYGWAVDTINTMTRLGILKGYADGTFRPENPVSKAEFTVMFYRLFNLYRPNMEPSEYQVSGIEDVPASYWAFKEISEIYDIRFHGDAFQTNLETEKFRFQPDSQLTRYQLAKILYSAIGGPIENALSPGRTGTSKTIMSMKDVPYKVFSTEEELYDYRETDGRYQQDIGSATDYFFTNGGEMRLYPILFLEENGGYASAWDDVSGVTDSVISVLHLAGIITSDSSGYYRPYDKVSRAEMVTILDRAYSYLKHINELSRYSNIQLEESSSAAIQTSQPVNAGTQTTEPVYASTQTAQTVNLNSTISLNESGVGTITQDLKSQGEINTTVNTKGYKSMIVQIQSNEKVDLYLKYNGQISFLRYEEMPFIVPVNGLDQVQLVSQLRPSKVFRADISTILSVELKNK